MPTSSSAQRWRDAVRGLSWFHRWTGVLCCIAFAVWFASGLVMVFVPYPSLSDAQRHAHAERLQMAQVRVAPGQALRAAGGGSGLRLIAADGHARYVVMHDGRQVGIDATTGNTSGELDAPAARRVASRFSGAQVKAITGPLDYDQWIVHQKFDPWRPFYRADLADAAHTQLYVSARTGEVLQRTTRWERGWNWVGSIPHWLYFTALRQSFHAWDWTMWCVALVALAGATVGTYLGLYRTYQRVAAKRAGWSPFKGLWRWHHGLGLAAAAFVMMWIFSGWLSMDHGRLFSRGIPDPQAVARYEGASLPEALQGTPARALPVLRSISELVFQVVGRHVLVAGWQGDSGAAKVTILERSGATTSGEAAPLSLVTAAVHQAWPHAVALPSNGEDALYRAADGLPRQALRYRLVPTGSTEVYIDRQTGRILLQENTSRRAYAWSYFALHTSRFGALADHATLRISLQVVLLLLGLGFSITGIVMGYRRLRMSLPRRSLR